MFNPIAAFVFPPDQCFLSGKIADDLEMVPVFPEWIMKRYDLHEKTLMMLAENKEKYADLKVPCAPDIMENFLLPLEHEIQAAFESGYEEVRKVPAIRLFQWMAKLMYGVLYNDLVHGIRELKRKNDTFKLSPLLSKKFSNLHCMLQSVFRPVIFEDFVPWSIEVFPVSYSQDVFNYKDETKNINFSLGMNGFGIVACLQDNGQNSIFHEHLLKKISGQTLHPIQFEEICARFLYSNYLLHTSNNYDIEEDNDRLLIRPVEDASLPPEPRFRRWDDKTFSQVLANYWKPWGLTTRDIYDFPNSPISFLVDDYTNEFIDPKSISHQH